MREKLLKSLRFTLKDAENWIELAKNPNNKCWFDDMAQYILNLGRAYQTALILRSDYNENGEDVQAARRMRRNMENEINSIQELHKEEKRTCAQY